MKDDMILINEDEIAEYVYEELIEEGYAPKVEEVKIIAEILLDFMFLKGLLGVIDDGE